MKRMKKVFAFLLTMVMVLAMAVPAMAQTIGTATTGTGSITISNPTNGQTYSVYKLFDATVATDGTIAYTGDIPEKLNSVFEKVPNTTNNIQVKSNAVSNKAFTAAAVATINEYVNALTTATASAKSNGTSPLVFNNLPYGYYAVKSSLGTVLSVDSTNPNVEVRDKNTTTPGTDADKKIVTGTTTSDDGVTTTTTADTTTAKIGDTINYQIKFTAQNYDEKDEFVYQYVITDTPTGVDIDTSTLSYSICKGTGSNQYDTEHAVTVNKANDGKVTITIPWGDKDDKASYYETPATVTITYSATLTATTGSNKANVNYNTGHDGTTTNEPKVYTAQFNLTKVAAESLKNDKYETTLAGAEFELYDANENGNKITVSEKLNEEGNVIPNTYVVDENGNAKIVSGSDGKFVIEGLKQGTNYWLQETKAPAGYSLPSARIALDQADVSTTGITNVSMNITNSTAGELPSTGGIGTTIFYVIGAICVLGAGVLLVTRRRMASK